MAKAKERLDMDQFIASFRKGVFAPCYFFCGDERYPIDAVIDAAAEHAVEPSMREFNLDLVHGNETDGKRVVAMASAYPMMAERRLVIVKDFDRVSGKDALDAYVEHPSTTTVLMMVSNNPDFRKKPYSTFKKAGIVHESREWYDNETVAWIEKHLRTIGARIEPAAVQLLHSSVGNNLRELRNEVEKVILARGTAGVITAADVERVVGISREYTAFQLCDRIGEKNMARALEIAQRMLGSGESVVGLIAAVTNHFQRLWKLQDAVRQGMQEKEMLSFVYFNSFALKNSLTQVRNYSPAQIEQAFVLLAEADLAAKSSGDPQLIMTTLIAELISGTVPGTGVAVR